MRKRSIFALLSILVLLFCASLHSERNTVPSNLASGKTYSSNQNYSAKYTMGTPESTDDETNIMSDIGTNEVYLSTKESVKTLVATQTTTLMTTTNTKEIAKEFYEKITTVATETAKTIALATTTATTTTTTTTTTITTTTTTTTRPVVTTVEKEVRTSEDLVQDGNSEQSLYDDPSASVISESDNFNDYSQDSQNTSELGFVVDDEYTFYENNEVEQYEEDTPYVEAEEQQYYSDCIIISNNVIPVFCGAGSQENVDAYEVVQDTEYFCDTNKILLFGHVYKSFGILDSVAVGDEITLINNYNEMHYYVTRSEHALYEPENKDFRFPSDGEVVIKRNYDEPTIILVTCKPDYGYEHRWIVTAVMF